MHFDLKTIVIALTVLGVGQTYHSHGQASQADCAGALVVCGDTNVDVPGLPGDLFDFDNANNGLGCHLVGEVASTWLYFSFTDDMPPGSTLEFSITPYEGGEVDYDFAIYDADMACDSLGDPIRCSFSWAISNMAFDCGFCPATGLGNGETDFNEDPFGNGFVAPIQVNPGEGFYLYLNQFFYEVDEPASAGFNIVFGGSAADYFDCGANPNCENIVLNAGPDTLICSGETPFQMTGTATLTTGAETYEWVGDSGEEAFLDDPNSSTPLLLLPDGYSGVLDYTLTLTAGSCIITDSITITVQPTPAFGLPNDTTFCSAADSLLIGVAPGFDTYQWSNDSTTNTITVDTEGTYGLTVTASGGCTISDTVNVQRVTSPEPVVIGPDGICLGDTITLDGGSGYDTYTWNGQSGGRFLEVTTSGLYILEVTASNGCTGRTEHIVSALTSPILTLTGPVGLCPDENSVLNAGIGYSGYQWNDGTDNPTLSIDSAGTYSVTITNNIGCSDEGEIIVAAYPEPTPMIVAPDSACEERNVLLLVNQAYDSYLWSTSDVTSAVLVDGPGTYRLTVTNDQGCTGADTVTIGAFPMPVLTLPDTVESCLGVPVTVGPTDDYASYAWNTTETTQNITVSTPGTYNLTVTDGNNCPADASVELINNPLPTTGLDTLYTFCEGTSVLVQASTGFSDYTWSEPSIVGSSFLTNTSGQYTLTVTDDNGCIDVDTFRVASVTALQPTILGDTLLCDGDTLTLTTSASFNTYSWSGGATDTALQVTAAGTYGLTVTDTEGCQGTAEVTVTTLDSPILVLDTLQEICTNDTLLLAATDLYDSYAWSTGSSDPQTEVYAGGQYSLTVTDANGCSAVSTVSVTENAPIAPTVTGDLSFCFQDSTVLSASDPAFLQYNWSTGQTADTAVFSASGMYDLMIVDTNGCSSSISFQINENPALEPVIAGDTVACEGQASQLSAGQPFEEYLWSNGATTPAINADTAGTYTLQVTDAQGCTGTGSFDFVLQSPPDPLLADTAYFCNDGSFGLLISDATGVTYAWSTGDTTNTIEASTPGIYSLIVTDSLGCEGQGDIELIGANLPSPNVGGDLTLCPGDTNAIVIAQDYESYQWSTGDTTSSISITQAGFYQITVTDQGGCTSATNIFIVQASGTDVDILGAQDICEGDTLVLTASDNILYEWSTTEVSQEISIAETGTYSVTATNLFGCSASDTVQVAALTLPDPGLPDSIGFCANDSLTIAATTGWAAYEWQDGSSADTLVAQVPGWYTLQVTDSNGCIAVDSTLAVVQASPVPSIIGAADFCPGDSLILSLSQVWPTVAWNNGDTLPLTIITEPGTIQVAVTDGLGCSGAAEVLVDTFPVAVPTVQGPPGLCQQATAVLTASAGYVDYVWQDGTSGPTIAVDSAGQYQVTATDSNGCASIGTLSLSAFPSPDVDIVGPDSVCTGETATLSADMAYAGYEWSTSAVDSSIVVNGSGQYALTVTDGNGCTASDTLSLVQLGLPAPSIVGDSMICGGTSTTLTTSIEYELYDWGDNTNLPTITVDSGGQYNLTVTDSFGCIGSASFGVSVLPVPEPMITGSAGLCAGEAALLQVVVSGADSLWWNTGSEEVAITVTEPGLYEVFAQNSLGCIGWDSLMVKELELPTIDLMTEPILCLGDTLSLSVVTNAATILWTTSDTTATITVTEGGNYGVTATGTNGCVSDTSYTVTAQSPPLATAGTDQAIDCNQSSVAVGSAGGIPELVYTWQGPGITPANQNLPDPTVTIPGIYVLSVADTLTGCLGLLDTVVVDDLRYDPVALLNTPDTIDCGDPTVTLDGTGSTTGSGVIYAWLGADGEPMLGENDLVLETSSAGTYTLQVVDTLTGCSNTVTAQVVEETTYPEVFIADPDDFTCLVDTVVLSATATAPSGTVSLLWLDEDLQPIPGGNTPSLTATEPGWYYLLVTEAASGCQTLDSVQIQADTLSPIASAGPDTSIDCLSEAVNLDGTASSAGPNFTYEWVSESGNLYSGTPTPEVDQPGGYVLTVTNLENGCTSTDAVMVNMDDAFLEGVGLTTIDPLCYGEENGQILISGVEGGTPPFLFSLNGGGLSDQQSFVGLGAGVYTLSVEDLAGCTYSITVPLEAPEEVQVVLPDELELTLGASTTIYAQTNLRPEEIAQVIWNPVDTVLCTDCLYLDIAPTESGLYQVEVIDTNGCSASDQLRLLLNKDRQVYIPNAFSPNNDGPNDLFMIFAGDDVVQINHFMVFGRWGEELFRADEFAPNNPVYGWDGRFRGQKMNMGTYVYYAEIEFKDGEIEVFKGDVNLIR